MTKIDTETLTVDQEYIFGYTCGGIEIDCRIDEAGAVYDVQSTDSDVMTLRDGVARDLAKQIQVWYDEYRSEKMS